MSQDRISHDDWMHLATEEYRRMLELLVGLDERDWRSPTDCTAWDVRETVAHCVGMAEMQASVREAARQMRLGRKEANGRPVIDGANDLQVRERRERRHDQLVADLRDASVRAVRARRRVPALLRAFPVPFGPPLGTKPLGYLVDRIYTRDVWMHRIDLSRATGQPLVLTPDHDGRLMADVVAEWADRHGRPYDLTLDGPAGGRYSRGSGGEQHRLDAVEFARIMAGRAPGDGLLTTTVPF